MVIVADTYWATIQEMAAMGEKIANWTVFPFL